MLASPRRPVSPHRADPAAYMAPAALPVQVEKERKGLRRRATVGDLGPSTSLALPSALPDLLPTLQGTLHKRHRTSRVREWGARLSFQRVRPSNRPLAIQPFSPPSLLPGKRHFRVDDLAGMLCYFRTELQLLKNEPVLKLRLGNLASVRSAPFSRSAAVPLALSTRPRSSRRARRCARSSSRSTRSSCASTARRPRRTRPAARAAAPPPPSSSRRRRSWRRCRRRSATSPPRPRRPTRPRATSTRTRASARRAACSSAPTPRTSCSSGSRGCRRAAPPLPPRFPVAARPPAPLPPFLLQPCQHLPRPSRPPGAHRQAMGRRAAATTRRRRRVRRARPLRLGGLPRPRRRRLDRRPPRDVRHAARSSGAGRRCRGCCCAAAAAAKARLRACRCAAPRSPPDQRSPPAHHAASCAAR